MRPYIFDEFLNGFFLLIFGTTFLFLFLLVFYFFQIIILHYLLIHRLLYLFLPLAYLLYNHFLFFSFHLHFLNENSVWLQFLYICIFLMDLELGTWKCPLSVRCLRWFRCLCCLRYLFFFIVFLTLSLSFLLQVFLAALFSSLQYQCYLLIFR